MQRILFAIGFGLIGLFVGCVVAVHAWAMCGGGHGWCSAFQSAISLVGAPLAGIAWVWSNDRKSLITSVPALLIGVVSDFKIIFDTREAGFEYLVKLWRGSALFMLIWALLFVSWQIWAAVSVVNALWQPSELPERK